MLRLLAEIAVAHCLASELPLGGPRPGALNFIAVDAFVRLLCTLIRCALPPTLAFRDGFWHARRAERFLLVCTAALYRLALSALS